MDHKEFDQCFELLADQYGSSAYSKTKTQIFWEEMCNWDPGVGLRVTKRLIANKRFAPTLEEAIDFKCDESEARLVREKQRHANDAKAFWKSTYHPEEIKWMVEMIKNRIEGKVSDADYAKFVATLKDRADMSEAMGRKNAVRIWS